LTNPQLSYSNKNLVFGLRRGLTSRHSGLLTVGSNVTLNAEFDLAVSPRRVTAENVSRQKVCR
jgi:hypothetical protein